MTYQFLFFKQAKTDINKLGNTTKRLLENWINKHLVNFENPKAFGKALSTDKKDLWKYRIGDYRLICQIYEDKFIILALSFGHRSKVYK